MADLMAHETKGPAAVVDHKKDGVRIDASTHSATLAANTDIRQHYPILSAALPHDEKTIGSDLLQRTRCPYFHDMQSACNKRAPGLGCDAIMGQNQPHAIIGASEECIAVHPSDMAVAMVALGAQVETALTKDGGRILPVDALHRLPGSTPHIDHQLRKGERVMSVVLPKPAERQLYRVMRDRSSGTDVSISIAITFDLELDHFMNIRIGLGGVAHKPWRAARAEEVLEGKAPSPKLFAKAAHAELAEARGYGHNDFKNPMMRELIVDTLSEMTR